MLKPVELANLVPQSLQEIDRGHGSHKSYLAQIYTGSANFQAFIKLIPDYELAREITVAQLGKAIGLPTLAPIMVNVEGIPSETKYAFATVHKSEASNFTQFANNDSIMRDHLKKWSLIKKAICFDEWIANADRTPENILIEGNNKYVLIDHGESFPQSIQPDSKYNNGLARIVIDGIPKNEMEMACRKTIGSCSNFSLIDFDDLSQNSRVANWQGNEYIEGCIQVLKDRISFLPELLEQEFMSGQRQFKYNDNNN